MEKKQLIAEILEIELKMFVAVRSRYPVSCQKNPEGFCVMRSAQFSVWSKKTLRSYFSDRNILDNMKRASLRCINHGNMV